MQLALRLDGAVELVSGVWHDNAVDPDMEALNAAWSTAIPQEGLITQWTQPDGRMVAAVWGQPGMVSADWSDPGPSVPARTALGSARVLLHDVADPRVLVDKLADVIWEGIGVVDVDWGYGSARFTFETIMAMPLDTSGPLSPFFFPKPVAA